MLTSIPALKDSATLVQWRLSARVALLHSECSPVQIRLVHAMSMDRFCPVYIEHGICNVMLANLIRLAGTLDVTLAELPGDVQLASH